MSAFSRHMTGRGEVRLSPEVIRKPPALCTDNKLTSPGIDRSVHGGGTRGLPVSLALAARVLGDR